MPGKLQVCSCPMKFISGTGYQSLQSDTADYQNYISIQDYNNNNNRIFTGLKYLIFSGWCTILCSMEWSWKISLFLFTFKVNTNSF